MRKLLLVLIVGVTLLLAIPKHVSAHAGTGPPFLKINGKYAQTYQYYLGTSPLILPWDIAPASYLVNQPISFAIDTSVLQIPQVIINGALFRWTFTGASKQYFYGTSLTHTYTQPGSYFISVEVKSANEQNFTLIDSTQIDVLPNSLYQLPKVAMSVATNNYSPTLPVLFKGSQTTDKSAHIVKQTWDFGDGQIARAQNAIHTYKTLSPYTNYVAIYQAVDSNGFIATAGVKIDTNNGKLVFSDMSNHPNVIPVSTNFAKEAQTVADQSSAVPPWVVILGLAVLFLGSAFVIQFALGKK